MRIVGNHGDGYHVDMLLRVPWFDDRLSDARRGTLTTLFRGCSDPRMSSRNSVRGRAARTVCRSATAEGSATAARCSGRATTFRGKPDPTWHPSARRSVDCGRLRAEGLVGMAEEYHQFRVQIKAAGSHHIHDADRHAVAQECSALPDEGVPLLGPILVRPG